MVFPGQGFLFDGLCLVISEKTFLPPCGTSHSTTSVYCVTFAPCFSLEWLGVRGRVSPGFLVQNWCNLGKKRLTWKASKIPRNPKEASCILQLEPTGQLHLLPRRFEISMSCGLTWGCHIDWKEGPEGPEISYRSHLKTMRTLIHMLRTRQYDRKKNMASSCTWIGGAHQPCRLPFMFHATGQLAQAKIETDLTGRILLGERTGPQCRGGHLDPLFGKTKIDRSPTRLELISIPKLSGHLPFMQRKQTSESCWIYLSQVHLFQERSLQSILPCQHFFPMSW